MQHSGDLSKNNNNYYNLSVVRNKYFLWINVKAPLIPFVVELTNHNTISCC